MTVQSICHEILQGIETLRPEHGNLEAVAALGGELSILRRELADDGNDAAVDALDIVDRHLDDAFHDAQRVQRGLDDIETLVDLFDDPLVDVDHAALLRACLEEPTADRFRGLATTTEGSYPGLLGDTCERWTQAATALEAQLQRMTALRKAGEELHAAIVRSPGQ